MCNETGPKKNTTISNLASNSVPLPPKSKSPPVDSTFGSIPTNALQLPNASFVQPSTLLPYRILDSPLPTQNKDMYPFFPSGPDFLLNFWMDTYKNQHRATVWIKELYWSCVSQVKLTIKRLGRKIRISLVVVVPLRTRAGRGCWWGHT